MSVAEPALSPDAVPAGAPGSRLHNRVLPTLVGAAALATLGCGFVTLAPNRLVSGRPIGLFAVADSRFGWAIAGLGALLLIAAFAPPSRLLHRAAAVVTATLLLLVPAAAGEAAAALVFGAPPLARVSLGVAFWVLFAAAMLALVDALQRARIGLLGRLAIAAGLALAMAAMAAAGLFDALSLAREYHAHRAAFAAALERHILLVGAAVGPAALVGLPLGIAAARRPGWQGPIFAVLNLLQTIPSIALFGLLIGPLSALAAASPGLASLGVGGVGAAPAVIALVLYALLPVVRNSVAGVAGVDPAVIDAARGMGMTGRQLLWRIELPLALPLLVAGLRIVTVQGVGLAVVAALIGAGGLGTFVFTGLGQSAADLVLLGALPAIFLALAADFLLQTLAAALARR
ncbi:MAG TPA: ABC transporter permease [Stellaceae bacterium]|nr:ABC transporter permease [Stellaceae bacterium]